MMISYALSPSPWSGVLKRPDTIIAGQWGGIWSEEPFSGKSLRDLTCDPSSRRGLPGLNGGGGGGVRC